MTDKTKTIVGRHVTRLLCPDCEALRQIGAHSDDQLLCVLACGHVRTLALLPRLPGSVSLENIVANDELAQRWFPFQLEDRRCGLEFQVIEQKERERWAA